MRRQSSTAGFFDDPDRLAARGGAELLAISADNRGGWL
jgi:hypothetical protein